MTAIINLTPHPIHFLFEGEDGPAMVTFDPAPAPARVSVERIPDAPILRPFAIPSFLPVFRTRFGRVEGLPEQVNGTYYIVSRIVAEACERPDLLVPDDVVRDTAGRIMGCRAFARV